MQHSASSIALAERCPRAWWLRYREGLKPPEIPWLKAKRAKARGERLPAGAYSRALGTEMHRLAEIYLTTPPRKAARLIDWNDLPGQCLAELVPHLPPAGSVPRRRVEARMSLKVDGVSFRGLIDVLAGLAEVWDHKTTRSIREYALLPDAVARAVGVPNRSLRDDLQACLYALYRAGAKGAGALCRWNYTETDRVRRSLPVVQYIPRTHALTVANRAAATARTVEAFRTKDDATPDTSACDQYGGCWYRYAGHCTVPRKMSAVIDQAKREAAEKQNMGIFKLKDLQAATAKANADEEAKAAAPAKRKPVPPPVEDVEDVAEDEDEDVAEDEDTDEEAPEETPAPRRKRVAKATRKPRAPTPSPVDAAIAQAEDAPEETAPAPTAREAFNTATSAPDEILKYFKRAGLKGEASIVSQAFGELADYLATNLPRTPERAQCLRKMLEASDCAVRAASGG